MRAAMLAAGIGKRLGAKRGRRPKVLLEFGGRTLLQRHLEILAHVGICELVLVTGYRADAVEAALARAHPPIAVETVHNADYQRGSIVSLWCLRESLADCEGAVLMDADVLYDHRLMARLLSAPEGNCLAMDREIEPGEEPVKVCLRGGRVVDFDKHPRNPHDRHGEWVGFFKLSRPGIGRLFTAARRYIDGSALETMYEKAIRDSILGAPEAVGVADVSGLPWIEIDFPQDVERAQSAILPRLEAVPA